MGAKKRKRSKRKLKWKLITRYDVLEYQCGLKAGDYVRLRRDLVIRYHDGRPTGDVYRAGQIWKVLAGASEDPGVVFFLRPDGKMHTWDDDASSISEWFERVEPPEIGVEEGDP